ncbi:putative cysteine synthase [Trypanosoma conorhini]|uniref:cysteine synthase n=1 Tax=Trypanosoma conorhini TaxID=83891 RepID=A0A422MR52_9TRYP|nr:putative cysteine synthase [Trypanosoma conorhini]RNE95674.1 putative cysteine synthase [Trypanosoma conorhini]
MTRQVFDRRNNVAPSMDALIGDTPAVYLTKMNNTAAKIVLKLESLNPMTSVKDRLAYAVYEKAERDGKLIPGRSVVVEATSGNTGIALAQLGAIRGYKVIIIMPESMSIERRCLMRIFGAELLLTPAALDMKGSLALAHRIVGSNPDAVLVDQFSTKYNAQAHQETTGPEIWRQTQGQVDCFVAGVGTGGTLTGVARYLKSVGCGATIVAVEPAESPVLAGGKPGPHRIQGIGAGFVPQVLEGALVDEVIQVPSDAAIDVAQRLPREEGIFCGISGGANVYAALQIARRPDMAGKTIVTIIPSFGERYLSTALYTSVKEEVTALPVESEV